MRKPILLLVLILGSALAPAAWSFFKPNQAGVDMTESAARLVASLSDQQRAITLMRLDDPKRVDWHFIPKDYRKGLQIKDMTDEQRSQAHELLKSALSELGYGKATKIMELETLLHALEKGRGRNIRDPLRYYVTIFGEPKPGSRWGLSFEGHHLSLNFVVDDGRIVASTPQFMAANPATVKDDYIPQIKKGTRILAKEEQLAFDLVNSLDAGQQKVAIFAEESLPEIRDAGSSQPSTDPPAGLAAEKMTASQRRTLQGLVQEYVRAMPEEVRAERMKAIEEADAGKIHFAWAGAIKPGVGHYYRVQGPTFLIEFVNTQPDAAGNLANHIHCVWRDMAGDFGIPIEKSK